MYIYKLITRKCISIYKAFYPKLKLSKQFLLPKVHCLGTPNNPNGFINKLIT